MTSTGSPNDYYVINIGQLKNAAASGYVEMEARLAGGSGTAISTLVSGFINTNNYMAANIGQLKNVAKPFYDRLIELNLAAQYPWTTNTGDDADYNLANIGQLKNVFNFNLSQADSDLDGLPDWWEMQYGLNPTSSPASGLVCWYRFNEGQGSSIVNYASSAYTGLLINASATNWIQGHIDGALWFDGVDDYIEIAQPISVITQNNFTVAAYVYFDGTTPHSYPSVVSDIAECGGYYPGYALGYERPSGALFGWVATCSYNSEAYAYNAQFNPSNRWFALVQTYDGTDLKLYVNGTLYQSVSGQFAPTTNDTLWIGRSQVPPDSSSWRGGIDDVRIYTNTLSSNQVFNLYGGGDSDNDGVSDFDEYQLGTDPTISNGLNSIIINFPPNWRRNP